MSNDSTITALGADADRRLWGWGVRSVPIDSAVGYARDIILAVTATGTRDLDLVDGFDSLKQDLQTALGTALGADPLNTQFGFDGMRVIAVETDPLRLRASLRAAVVNVLRSDPRVVSVSRVLIGDEIPTPAAGDSTNQPSTREYGLLQIEASFRLVSGIETSLELGPILAGA